MARFIEKAAVVPAAGNSPEIIEECLGRLDSGDTTFSAARMGSPEPGGAEHISIRPPAFSCGTVRRDG